MGRTGIPEGKRWLVLAAFLGALSLGAMFFPEDAPVSVVAGNHPKEGERGAALQEKEGRWKILGEEIAKGKELKDPFTLLHEGREEGSREMGGETPREAPRLSGPVAEGPVRAQMTKAETVSREWTLKGVLSGEKGRIAIVSNGEETRDVAVGESFGGRTVVAIEETSLHFSAVDGGGEMHLPGF